MIADQLNRDIVEHLPQAVLVANLQLDPETGARNFIIEYANPAWESISGALLSTIQGKVFSGTVYAKTTIPWEDLCRATFADGVKRRQTLYSDLVDKWLDISVSRLDADHVCVNITDVSDLKQGETRLKEQNLRLSSLSAELSESRNNLKVKLEKIENLNNNLEQLAYYDRLTGLPNRIRFNQILTEEIEMARRGSRRLALAILDIDNLKTPERFARSRVGRRAAETGRAASRLFRQKRNQVQPFRRRRIPSHHS